MFAGIIVISSFTAAIASALTVNRLESQVKGPDDLPGIRVGSLPDSTSEDYLAARQIPFQSFRSVPEGLAAVEQGKIDAFVYDAPLLRYRVNQEYLGRVQVLPHTLKRQDYGFALPMGSPLREAINRALLEIIADPEWDKTLLYFLGR
jgi:ABC-type amino acid transport substrate-binding protein